MTNLLIPGYAEPVLSKSQYTRYLQCPKAFWISRKAPERLTPPSTMQQRVFDTGHEVGRAARELFPGGVAVEFDVRRLRSMVRRTHQLVDSGAEVIYEASFLYDDVFAAVDILRREGPYWHLYEVKSATGMKETFLDDTAVQAWVLEGAGLELRTVNVVHLNSEYVRQGELDLSALFTVVNVTSQARLRRIAIPVTIEQMKLTLAGPDPERPIGPHCLSPYECPAKDWCWRVLSGVPEYSVFNLTGARQERKFELYGQGIVELTRVPLEDCTEAQRLQVTGEHLVLTEPVRDFVASLTYPVAHLDFESFQPAIPPWQGVRPYQQVPFQYSLHIEQAPDTAARVEKPVAARPEAAGGEESGGGVPPTGGAVPTDSPGAGMPLTPGVSHPAGRPSGTGVSTGEPDSSPTSLLIHREYLAPLGVDPRRGLAEALLADLPESGTILTYNQVFEKGVIGQLAETFDDLRPALLALLDRVEDLMIPFARHWYYHPDQRGRHSIKNVLPALVPEMAGAYRSLPGIADGGEASSAWAALSAVDDPAERERTLSALREYCRLDTLAMVRILEVLQQV